MIMIIDNEFKIKTDKYIELRQQMMKKLLKINEIKQVIQEYWNMKKLKKYLQNCQTLKKILNEVKYCLNELKNVIISELIFKKQK